MRTFPLRYNDADFSSSLQRTANVAIAVAFPLASVLGVVLVDRVGRRLLFFVGSLGMAAGLAVLAILLEHAQHPFHWLQARDIEGGSMAVSAVVAWVFFFSISWGPLPWCIAPELFPLRIRATAMSLGVFCNWVADWLVVAGFVPLTSALGNHGAVWCYVPVCLFAAVLVYLCVPETAGKSLEDIQSLYDNSQQATSTGNDLTAPLLANQAGPSPPVVVRGKIIDVGTPLGLLTRRLNNSSQGESPIGQVDLPIAAPPVPAGPALPTPPAAAVKFKKPLLAKPGPRPVSESDRLARLSPLQGPFSPNDKSTTTETASSRQASKKI
eukprot:g63245.t1